MIAGLDNEKCTALARTLFLSFVISMPGTCH